jgi:hypothetical protein
LVSHIKGRTQMKDIEEQDVVNIWTFEGCSHRRMEKFA